MDMSPYKNLFLSEAREYLQTINETVALLGKSPSDRAAIDTLFRGAHSLKGMAASMEVEDVVAIAHQLEDLMIRVREGMLAFQPGVAELILDGADLIEGLLNDIEQELQPRRPLGDLSNRLAAYGQPAFGPGTPEENFAPASAQAEPWPQPHTLSRGEFPPEPTPLWQATPEAAKAREPGGELSTVRVNSKVLDHLVNLTGELITNKHRLLNIGQELDSPALNEALSRAAKLLRALHDEVMKVRLMPFDAICDRLKRSVRALAKKSGKDLVFEVEGRDIGLDRGILERLADPLNHILRNAVDHGLEDGDQRLAAGKPAQGKIRLRVSRDRDRVLVTVSDDGRGMEPQSMIDAALAKGLLAPEEAELLTPRQALMLACIPGFSTAKQVSELSGRGVGMDAVNATIRKLGGSLGIDSEPGKGSSFTLRLPMTIAIIHALIVQCGSFKVAIPVSVVQRSMELRREELEMLGKRRVFRLEGEAIPLLSLNHMLGVPHARLRRGFMSLFVTEAKGRRIGVVVDRLLGQHELFVKPLGRPLSKLAGVEGAATLGDGEIVTILNVAELL